MQKTPKTILVIEDDPSSRAILEHNLAADYQVLAAENGEAGIKLAQGSPRPDLILLDVMLPDVDGYEVCKRLKADRGCGGVPVIMLTAKESESDESLGFAAGAVDYIHKPFNPLNLRLRIKVHLATAGDLLRVSAGQARELKLQQVINATLLSIVDDSGLQNVLRSLCNILGVEFGYLVFFTGGEIFNTDIWSEDAQSVFLVSHFDGYAGLPRQAVLRPGAGSSLIGALPCRDAAYLPVQEHGQLVGCLEFGAKAEINPQRFKVFAQLCAGLTPSLLAVYKAEIRTRTLHKTNLKLKETEQLYHVLLDDSNDLIISFDPRGRILNINSAGLRLLACESADQAERFNLVSPDFDFLADMLRTRPSINDIEVIFKDRADAVHYGLASLNADFDDQLQVKSMHAIVKDMTEHIEFQQKLWQTNIALGSANDLLKKNQVQMVQQEKLASIGELAAGVAHEINNPLAFVNSNHSSIGKYLVHLRGYIGDLEALCGGAGIDFAAARAARRVDFILGDLDTIMAESATGYQRIMSIVTSLKDFSRIDTSGKINDFNLNEAVRNTLVVATNSFKYVAKVETDLRLESTVECSGDQINQVILNLVVNAAQAIEGQRRDSLGLIRLRTWEENGQAMLECSDDGPGIPESIRNRVFEPFFTTKDVGKGTGLGLSITHDIIVNKHQGHIHIDDNPGGGARFLIGIPLLFAGNSAELGEMKD